MSSWVDYSYHCYLRVCYYSNTLLAKMIATGSDLQPSFQNHRCKSIPARTNSSRPNTGLPARTSKCKQILKCLHKMHNIFLENRPIWMKVRQHQLYNILKVTTWFNFICMYIYSDFLLVKLTNKLTKNVRAGRSKCSGGKTAKSRNDRAGRA